uniref:RNA helicase n=1 Tax=Periophthalmus magnuspinnatus TaxID=409849 RepID=A0A3B4A9G8_9GOBI
ACGDGVESVMLALEFKLERSSTSFYIVRFIEAVCKTTAGRKALCRPLAPPTWTPPTKVTIVDGQLPESSIHVILTVIEKILLTSVNTINSTRYILIMCFRQKTLQAPLSINNYKEKLQLLLHLEEYQMERDIRRYNVPNDNLQEVTMQRDSFNEELLVLKITAENRPTLQRGDQLLVYPVGEIKKKYRGYVHSVQLDSVKLGFSKELLDIFVKGMTFHIEFTVNRLNLRTQHRATEFAVRSGLAAVLFPLLNFCFFLKPLLYRLFDRKLGKNPEQYRAVQHIVAGSSKPAPYLLFGPPGTGKTVTVVEAIKQIAKCKPQSCILVCAFTNKAADFLCESLLTDGETQVLRIYAKSYNPQDVPDSLKDCCNLVGDYFEFPKGTKDLKSVNITTLLTSSRFVTDNFPEGHFTHVFVDGAECAREPECILPLAGLLDPNTGQVVLAGDPKQLGPIIRSRFAQRFGMGLSLLERLMTDLPLYQKTNGVFDNRFVTKLLRNYRSHPAILQIPNELFYDGELQAYADEQRNSCCSFGPLPQKGFPIIFHKVTDSSSSFLLFNNAEVDVLMDYVKDLLQTQGNNGLSNISPQDIGIIAPYRKQVQKILARLSELNMCLLQVGTLEEFQGQERRVILVSTVRIILTYSTCFCFNQWFNVAVNRAKALLIVVGNPEIFISYCKEKGGYKW